MLDLFTLVHQISLTLAQPDPLFRIPGVCNIFPWFC